MFATQEALDHIADSSELLGDKTFKNRFNFFSIPASYPAQSPTSTSPWLGFTLYPWPSARANDPCGVHTLEHLNYSTLTKKKNRAFCIIAETILPYLTTGRYIGELGEQTTSGALTLSTTY
ncbi:hypothetical protein ElyMa_005629300 [Elysia marginata]|uniref:Peptidase M16 N-terminal domain-containing protein n=1 Tax=Elysia marginata TaxID=1093978 RepID=A0AAV4F9M7_9GAST|nr:hypothetical protein ElyMa_005629300 [Elysia marginata]